MERFCVSSERREVFTSPSAGEHQYKALIFSRALCLLKKVSRLCLRVRELPLFPPNRTFSPGLRNRLPCFFRLHDAIWNTICVSPCGGRLVAVSVYSDVINMNRVLTSSELICIWLHRLQFRFSLWSQLLRGSFVPLSALLLPTLPFRVDVSVLCLVVCFVKLFPWILKYCSCTAGSWTRTR